MKKSIIASVFLIGIIGCASTPIQLPEKSQVINVPKQTRSQIYQKSLHWMTYIAGKTAIDYRDPVIGKVIGKAKIYLGSHLTHSINVIEIVTIDCFNEESKITVIPLGCMVGFVRGELNYPCSHAIIGDYVNELGNIADKLIADYTEYITNNQAPAWDGK